MTTARDDDVTSALVSVLGASMSAAFGLDVAWIAAHALPSQSQTSVDPSWHLTTAVLATGLLGVTASIIPPVRDARTDVLRAIQSP